MGSQQDQPPLEYARAHRLALNHTERHPLEELAKQAEDPLTNDCLFPTPESLKDYPPPERLQISRDALKLIAFAGKAPPKNFQIPDPYRYEKLKVELPMLRTVHEMDMDSFIKKVKPDLKNETLPMEKVDIEADEGLEWPSHMRNLPQEISDRIASEKLTISKEAFTFLSDALRPPRQNDIMRPIDLMKIEYKRPLFDEPITPPLLPMSPEFMPYEPDSEVGHMELPSDLTSPFRQELRDLDNQLLDNLAIVPGNSDPSIDEPMRALINELDNRSSTKHSLDNLIKTPERLKLLRKEDELKVYVPITPPTSGPTPWKKRTDAQEALLEQNLERMAPLLRPEGCSTSSESQERFFEEVIKPIANEVERETEQEQLVEEDTTCRVTVPVMDFTRPLPPWHPVYPEQPGNNTRGRAIEDAKEALSKQGIWALDHDLERSLRWAPFPSNLAQVALKEDMPMDEATQRLITRPPPPDTLAALGSVNRRRYLEDTPSDLEEIEPADFSEPAGIAALMRKRKLDIDKQEAESARQRTKSTSTRQDLATQDSQLAHDSSTKLEAFNLFLGTRGKEVKRKTRIPATQNHAASGTVHNSAHAADSEQLIPKNRLPRRTCQLPEIPKFEGKYPIIISSTIISQRQLLQKLKNLLPSLEIIEREFSSESTVHQQNLTDINKPASETDILISPGTGVLLTSLQKLHQRPLPGQKALATNIRSRVAQVAPRYNSLLVLVSQNQQQSEHAVPLSASDSSALSSFSAFTRSAELVALDVDVQVIYTPGGINEAAHWLAYLIAQQATDGEPFKLLQDETSWEFWLRIAGLNAFAAQVVLGKLKPPAGEEAGIYYGISKFVSMGEQERVDRFAGSLGGEALLRRVSQVLDVRWRK